MFTVLVSAMTGYAFAKYKAWWLQAFFFCILITTMLPTEVIMPSTFAIIRDLGLYNSLAGIIVPSIITATGIFMFRQYFRTVPDELLEAARIDGVGEIRAFFQIMLPIAKPIAVVLAIFSFQWRWNDYIWPLIVLNDPNKYTLQIALRSIVGADNIDWSVLLSASVISLIATLSGPFSAISLNAACSNRMRVAALRRAPRGWRGAATPALPAGRRGPIVRSSMSPPPLPLFDRTFCMAQF